MITFITDPYLIDPLGISYLSACLKRAGHKTELILTSELETRKISYPILAYSVTTGTHNHYLEINQWLRSSRPSHTSIFGGPHCTFLPTLAKERDVDYIFRGEGFEPIVKFCANFNSVYQLRTPNIGYALDGTVILNKLLPPTAVASLPFPDRSLIYQFEHNRKNPIKNVMASHGCPFSCSYCYSGPFKDLGYPHRIRPVNDVVEECKRLVTNYPATELIFFQDDTFPLFRPDWTASFCKKYGRVVKTPFHIQIRIEQLQRNTLKALKTAGLHGVTFAVETGDADARANLLNRRMSDRDIKNGAKLLHECGIRFRVENMLGIPGETVKSALATLDLNMRLRPDIGWASLYTPYPGTVLGEQCRESGLIDMEGWNQDFFTHATLELKGKRRIERLQKLFGLLCAIPQLRPFARLLIRFPYDYQWVYHTVKQYLYDNRLYKVQD